MMYWTVIGDHSHIEEAAMDGTLRRILVQKNLQRPTGIKPFPSLSFLTKAVFHNFNDFYMHVKSNNNFKF